MVQNVVRNDSRKITPEGSWAFRIASKNVAIDFVAAGMRSDQIFDMGKGNLLTYRQRIDRGWWIVGLGV